MPDIYPVLISHIGKIRKNDNASIDISIKQFNGKKYVDMRHLFVNGRGKEISKSAIAIGPKGLSSLISLLEDAKSQLLSDGA